MVAFVEKTVKTRLLGTARRYCANWNAGDCLGCMVKMKKNVIIFRITSKLAYKPCKVDSGCEYFNNIVIPGIPNGK